MRGRQRNRASPITAAVAGRSGWGGESSLLRFRTRTTPIEGRQYPHPATIGKRRRKQEVCSIAPPNLPATTRVMHGYGQLVHGVSGPAHSRQELVIDWEAAMLHSTMAIEIAEFGQ